MRGNALMLRNENLLHLEAQKVPLFPNRFERREVRRKLATRLRKRIGDVWPIMPGSDIRWKTGQAGRSGKNLPSVLTHDEAAGKAGLARCRSLMQLELELGFRSSFNFRPEGSYRVPAELREKLIASGFEVGIHDLKNIWPSLCLASGIQTARRKN